VPKLNILLGESLVAVYMSLLVHALAIYEANILYRLVAHPFSERMYQALFGGGVKKLIKVLTSSSDKPPRPAPPKDELAKQRMKLHLKVLGQSGNTQRLKEDKPTYKEKFVPPEVSMVSFLMTKPFTDASDCGLAYDSNDSAASSDEEDEDESVFGGRRTDTALNEHLDPNSYSWCLIRFAVVKFIRNSLVNFLPQIGIELPELPVCSPLLQAVLKTMEQWEELLQGKLELFAGPPQDYIPGCFPDSTVNGPTILKYKALLEPMNTPFLSNHSAANPAKRLWHFLVQKESLQEIFIRYIFKRKRVSQDEMMRTENEERTPISPEPMKIIHKDQEGITAFCVNQANLNCISVGTQKEVVEMDITGIIHPPVWLEDETEYDIETIRSPSPSRVEPEEFLVVHTPMDRHTAMMGGGHNNPPSAPGVTPAPAMGQSGRGGGVYVKSKKKLMAKRPVGGVRKMGPHPHLPYYLTGAQDGSVRLWEWGHTQCISVARQPGSFPKVSKVLFNAQGNKFGVSDGEGSMCLWQVGLGVNMNKPYLSLKCHNKAMYDFVFVGSSSLLATSGHSSENKNVCLWDTLLPHKNALVHGFSCHNDGSPALLYAPQHQVIISSGKKGDICIFDVRQRQIQHTFQAHDSAIRAMSLDPTEEFFITGSDDGDIKVWGLSVHNLWYSFPGEHSKSSIFRNMGSGVTQCFVTANNQLFSCGADGSMKVRQLPDRDLVVNSWC